MSHEKTTGKLVGFGVRPAGSVFSLHLSRPACILLHGLNDIALICSSKFIPLDWAGPLVLCGEEVARVPAGIPGIYLLHTFDEMRGAYPALYAGKTRDLRGRLAQHMDTGITSPDVRVVRSRVAMYFSAAPAADAAVRGLVETGLIRLLRPPFNRQVPRGPVLYTNLPPMVLTFRERRPSA